MFNTVNAQFQKFVDFATEKWNANEKTAIARLGGGETALSARTITAAERGTDSVGRINRGDDACNANNAVRAIFRNAVADLFGGERNIPKSVMDMMLTKDYDCGKPLTARRIIKVRNAIRETGWADAFNAQGTAPGEMVRAAEAARYTRTEFGKLNAAANLYARAFNIPLKDALLAVIDRTSEAHIAMESESLYMKDADSFRRGVLAHSQNVARTTIDKLIVADCAAKGAVAGYAKVARDVAIRIRAILDDPTEMMRKLGVYEDGGSDPIAALRADVNALAAEYESAAQRIASGEIKTEKDAYDAVINGTRFTSGNITARFQEAVTGLADLEGEVAGLEEVSRVVKKAYERLTAEINQLGGEFARAIAEREAPRVAEKLAAASETAEKNTGRPLRIPAEFAAGMKGYIGESTFQALKSIDKFCGQLAKRGDAALHFDDGQKARLKKLLADAMGAEKAEAALPKVVEELENVFYTEGLRDGMRGGDAPGGRPETVLRHFEANPEIVKSMVVGFDMGKVADIKAAIKAEMDADLAAVRAASNTTMTSLASGMMPQGVREYHTGYVTLNGQPIPIAKTDKEFLLADNVERRGYAEFLEEKFPEGRTKMRQTVSFVCGMALGLNGAVEHLLDKGRPGYDKILLGAPRSRAANHGAIMIQGSLDVRDNYDITEDEDGNVTIKLTHYASTGVINLLIGDEAIPCAKIDRAQPKVGEMKMTATVKITNATDAELGDAMPHFEVTDFTQEEVA